MQKIKVLIVDDHQIFRDGVVSLFSDVEEITIVGLASDGVEAIEKTQILHPDVVLLDISLPGISGIDVLKDITLNNGSNVLILSMHTNEEYVFKAISAGAKGYLPKEDTIKQELIHAIKIVAKGEEYYTNS
ncbi:MAG: response regulator transcription factor, partial [Saprospiraceae bacterium]|nr:response regulator transcription factor [Saprospiraceae bacterium]